MQDFQPKAASFDCIYSSEALHTVQEKEKLLTSCERALKARGQIALTDFVRTPGTKRTIRGLRSLRPVPARRGTFGRARSISPR